MGTQTLPLPDEDKEIVSDRFSVRKKVKKKRNEEEKSSELIATMIKKITKRENINLTKSSFNIIQSSKFSINPK